MSEQTSASDTLGSASSLAKVLLMTENMLAHARDDSWDAVTELEELRREALAICFAAPIPPNQAEVFSEALAAMLHMNEEMIGLLEAAKANVSIKRSDQTHTKRSLGHYLDIEQSH
jgi:hypothetical protein